MKFSELIISPTIQKRKENSRDDEHQDQPEGSAAVQVFVSEQGHEAKQKAPT